MATNPTTRLERLKEYANPRSRENWQGAGRDQANINRWVQRAHEHSDSWKHRAKSGKVDLRDLGGGVPDNATPIKSRETRNEGGKPYYRNEGPKMREQGKRDPNHIDEQYMPGVRRTTS
jgi:hypothetical protein